jgi:clan AA aspartic protease
METHEMGRVLVEARIDNIKDLWEVETGQRAATDARSVTITDALIDTGATGLNLPSRLIQQLGLSKKRERRIRTANGPRTALVYEAVRLTIQGRDCVVEVTELDDDVPVLIGQIPLEWLDFVVDPRNQRLIGNPAHGGEWTWEAY